jgi:predicted MFS family arabinose efflux permease
MPFQIGALIDGSGRTPAQAGLFALLEVGALAGVMILISPSIDRFPPRLLAAGGCLLAAAGSAGLFLAHTFTLQLLFSVLIGCGYGVIFAATIAGAAAAAEPDRLYAIGNGGALLLVVGLMQVLPSAGHRFGALGIFLAMSMLSVVSAPLLAGFKRAKPTEQVRLHVWSTPGAPGLLFSWAAFSTGTGSLYAFSERIGASIHLTPGAIATALSAGVFLGLLGTLAAAALGRKVNREWALIIGMCGSGMSCLLLGFASSFIMFAAGVCSYWIFYMFLYSYLLGTAAALDPSGRVGTLGGGCGRLGYALGAGLGGVLAEHTTYSATGMLGFIGCAVGMALGFPSLFKVLRKLGSALQEVRVTYEQR